MIDQIIIIYRLSRLYLFYISTSSSPFVQNSSVGHRFSYGAPIIAYGLKNNKNFGANFKLNEIDEIPDTYTLYWADIIYS
jgi:hypothetical protein